MPHTGIRSANPDWAPSALPGGNWDTEKSQSWTLMTRTLIQVALGEGAQRQDLPWCNQELLQEAVAELSLERWRRISQAERKVPGRENSAEGGRWTTGKALVYWALRSDTCSVCSSLNLAERWRDDEQHCLSGVVSLTSVPHLVKGKSGMWVLCRPTWACALSSVPAQVQGGELCTLTI